MRDTFIKTLSDICYSRKDIILITGDLGFGVLNDFRKDYPKQFINAGVAEQNMTGIATGLGMSGKTVFTYSIGNFCTLRCLEQIRNDACYHEANVNIIAIGGGFSYGSLGYSHHATEDISIMRALPNLKVFAPGDLWETERITEYMASSTGVNYLRLDKSWPDNTKDKEHHFEIGKARLICEGNDLTIIVSGGILEVALNVSKEFNKRGYFIRVLSMHTIKPIDSEAIIRSAKESGGIITLEEHTIVGGLGSAVAEVLLDNNVIPLSFKRLGLQSKFSTIVGSQNYLRSKYELDEIALTKAVQEMLTKAN